MSQPEKTIFYDELKLLALKLDDVKPTLMKQEDTKPSQAEIAAVAAAQQQHTHQQPMQVCQVPGHNFTVNLHHFALRYQWQHHKERNNTRIQYTTE